VSSSIPRASTPVRLVFSQIAISAEYIASPLQSSGRIYASSAPPTRRGRL
jgi:hypothetical protein